MTPRQLEKWAWQLKAACDDTEAALFCRRRATIVADSYRSRNSPRRRVGLVGTGARPSLAGRSVSAGMRRTVACFHGRRDGRLPGILLHDLVASIRMVMRNAPGVGLEVQTASFRDAVSPRATRCSSRPPPGAPSAGNPGRSDWTQSSSARIGREVTCPTKQRPFSMGFFDWLLGPKPTRREPENPAYGPAERGPPRPPRCRARRGGRSRLVPKMSGRLGKAPPWSPSRPARPR